jgi:pyrimidine-nucleoside phosphorylase
MAGLPHDAAVRILAAIADKRRGRALPAETVEAIVRDFVDGRAPDYQLAAWLATVACTGMTQAETVALTRAYVDSGARLNLGAALGRPVVDKHSTGGVGDKTTLFVVPVVASCGVAVAKVSGRGLGFAGGTVDKLESIRGLRTDLSASELVDMVRRANMAITGQSADLVPADRATYALRDVTGTVDSIPLIAASVMSKKIAVGATGVVLDVKFGSGAILPDRSDAEQLARLMIDLGAAFGVPSRAILSDMSQPLGYAVGNALEVQEAIRALSGEYIPGFSELCRQLAQLMLRLGEPALSEREALLRVEQAVGSGAALAQLRRWVQAQGGDVRQIDDPRTLPVARVKEPVASTRSGWVSTVNAREVGSVAAGLGAGRLVYGQKLDLGAGVVLRKKVGDRVEAGEPLAEIHWSGEGDSRSRRLRDAFELSEWPVASTRTVDALV